MSLVTPLDPGSSARARSARPATQVRESVHSTLFGRIAAAVASSCGSEHSVNEDAHSGLDRTTPIFVVADGVGGGAMAALASRQLVAHLHAMLEADGISTLAVCRAVLDADRAIAHSIAQLTDAPGASTVALCAPVNVTASKWLIAWVGDCRIYRLAAALDARFEALSADDSFARWHETPPPGSCADDPARMVGNGAVLRPNVAFTQLAVGDLLVACSDGVHKHLAEDDWRRLLRDAPGLAECCEAIVDTARAQGSLDDATVMLIQRAGLALAQRPARPRRAANDGDAA